MVPAMRSPARLAPLLVLALACPSLRPASETRSVPHTNPTPPRPEPPETMRGWELPSGRYLLDGVFVMLPSSPDAGVLYADAPQHVQRDAGGELFVTVRLDGQPLRLRVHQPFELSTCLRAPKAVRESGLEWHLGAGARVYLRGSVDGERMRIALAPWLHAPTYIVRRSDLSPDACSPRWPMHEERVGHRCLRPEPGPPRPETPGARLAAGVPVETIEARDGWTHVRVRDPHLPEGAPAVVTGWLSPDDRGHVREAVSLPEALTVSEGWPRPSGEVVFQWSTDIKLAYPRVFGDYFVKLDGEVGTLAIPGFAPGPLLEEKRETAAVSPPSHGLARTVLPVGTMECTPRANPPVSPDALEGEAHELPEGYGSLPRAVIRETIQRNIGDVRGCYERQLEYSPGLEGRLVYRFVIGRDGSVSIVGLVDRSGGFDPWVAACIARRMRAWRFPAPDDGGIVIVTYPFQLTPIRDLGAVDFRREGD